MEQNACGFLHHWIQMLGAGSDQLQAWIHQVRPGGQFFDEAASKPKPAISNTHAVFMAEIVPSRNPGQDQLEQDATPPFVSCPQNAIDLYSYPIPRWCYQGAVFILVFTIQNQRMQSTWCASGKTNCRLEFAHLGLDNLSRENITQAQRDEFRPAVCHGAREKSKTAGLNSALQAWRAFSSANALQA